MKFINPLNLKSISLKNLQQKNLLLTKIETDQVRYIFSSEGASLESLEFKRKWGGKESYLNTVFPPTSADQRKTLFLVALDTKTPYHFDLIKQSQKMMKHAHLPIKRHFHEGTLTKEFSVFKHEFRIDLIILFPPHTELQGTLQPRISFPSP